MPTHHFTLIVDGADLQDEAVVDSLFESGCDDGLVGSVDDTQFIDFDREAPSLGDAVLSAVADIERTDGVQVIRMAGVGLVSIAGIAARTGRSRDGVRLLIAGMRGPGHFPPPVTDPRARYRLWRWSDVERWFRCELGADPRGVRDDHVLSAINACLELRQQRHWLDAGKRNRLQELAGLSPESTIADEPG